ncbi:hypothetical protein AeNC1_014450 [Aphanomyces euteiches]|nr:hypothetical protein AeNC1_014450 [Aphanomyces euteiches]
MVCKLNKSIYGLKQAPRQWNKKLNNCLLAMGFKRCHKEQYIYVMVNSESRKITYLAVYVDDIVIATGCKKTLLAVRQHLTHTFEMTDKGELAFLLGMRIQRDRGASTVKISQSTFVDELLVKFHMQDCDTVPTPQVQGLPADAAVSDKHENLPYRSLTGALQYLVSATRPDIAFAVRFLSSHNHDYNASHWKMAKRVLKYLKGTRELGITYNGQASAKPQVYSDADFANDKLDSKSITGSIIIMAEGAITLPIDMFDDNQSAIQVAKATATNNRTKHIRLRFHFFRDLVDENMVNLQYIGTKDQIADIFTKVQTHQVFEKHRLRLGMH